VTLRRYRELSSIPASGGDKLVALTTSLPFPRRAKMSRFKADLFGCDTSGCPPRYEALNTK
ncbi:hypothetical protein KUCAC02_017784, partial [Chaenocephalus aceratus]